MGIAVWVGVFAVTSLFWVWIIFLGGADWLEGSWLAAFIISSTAMEWSAEVIKLFAGLMWFGAGIWFTIGLFVKDARLFLP